MVEINRQHTEAVNWRRSRRAHAISKMTSMPPGKIVPLAMIPLFREDSCGGRIRVAVEMGETKQLLANPVTLRLRAFCVPLLALERFQGSMEQFNRSYMHQPKTDDVGAPVVPFIETHAMGAHGSKAVYKYLGLHAKTTDQVNTMYLEAYNILVNWLRKNRSPGLTQRARLDATLAEAFWQRGRFDLAVPEFDQAVIDGEVALTIAEARMPVKGIGKANTNFSVANQSVYETDNGVAVTYPHSVRIATTTTDNVFYAKGSAATDAIPEIYAELQQNGVTVSLANIAQAKKAQRWAKVREGYEGIDDEYIIDLLMDGLSIPDQHLKQPFSWPGGDVTVPFQQVLRYATDAGNQSERAVSGGAMAELAIRVPRLSTGGVVVVVAEAVPVQMFERQRDPFFHSTSNVRVGDDEGWPQTLPDYLDTQKVDVLSNAEVDTDHASPGSTFAYVPKHWRWNSWGPTAGGDMYRPTTDTTIDVERARFWAVEDANPVLGETFYLVKNLHKKVFVDPDAEPFHASISSIGPKGPEPLGIEGNTQFGGVLVEATASNYDAVLDRVSPEYIDQD